ncbi:MAG: hypothetical protein IMZ61_08285 [Planctomycetes bacterium]|nr:hypothetical protein [Planctomycetota bacterium]
MDPTIKRGFTSTAKNHEVRVHINAHLLGICFTLFVIISALKPELMKNSFFSTQLALAIPFFLTSSFARSKSMAKPDSIKWDRFSYLTFILGYGLLINSTGILLSGICGKTIAILFFASNVALALAYSIMEVTDDRSKLARRIVRDSFFAIILLCLGLLPALKAH